VKSGTARIRNKKLVVILLGFINRSVTTRGIAINGGERERD
jgi:hypothetical protein